ncbi:TPA: hypothetical protein DCL30_04980 [Candidatus Peribacteria bacterium]|nr:MAG: hypothetical protein A3J91_00985 [Candidatus Peribacteria bacterium RIFOXYC2_FULL_58_10]OGJ84748.1 MAG: hypothetical protein A2529_01185 [Candidatus Peribacteria bacterium RIFOXYD2_FULL_58_15]HAI98856.1 hypothetical protein [Candidatus Peribacteria bacterium]HAS33745.1 hypothetical protein [Candidatus Peribacteria bacterium]
MNLRLSAHRHFLILPAFLCLLSVSLLSASSSTNASITRQADPKIERFPAVIAWGDAQAMVWSDTLVDRAGSVPRLLSGPMLIKTDGIVEMDAADLHLTGLYGGAYVTVRGGVVTVAALTAPMLATSGRRSVLIPAGLQWSGSDRIASYDAGVTQWAKSRSLSAVPTAFKRAQLMQLESFPAVALPTRSAGSSLDRFLSSLAFDGWRLPAAQQRVHRLYEEEVFRELTRCVREGDRDCVMEIVHDADNEEHLSGRRGQGILASLLSQVSGDSVMTNMLLTALMHDDRLWLLASIHPQWRLPAWGVDHPTPSREMCMLHLFVLPQSDVLADALPVVILQRWEQEAADLLALDADPRSLLNHLVEVLVPVVRTETTLGYPERARTLAASLMSIVAERKELLSPAASAAVRSFSQLGDEPLDATVHEETTSAASSSEGGTQPFDPEQVAGLAEELLRESGAAFTVQTSFKALTSSQVNVMGIVFSGVRGDASYDFLLDTARGMVSAVVVGGRPLPNTLSLREFVRWARLQ